MFSRSKPKLVKSYRHIFLVGGFVICCFYLHFLTTFVSSLKNAAADITPSVETRATSSSKILNDSSTATVIAMATGYNLAENARFVGSLRKTGFKGHIILAVKSDMKPKVQKYLTKQGVTMKFLNKVNCTYVDKSESPKNKDSHAKERMSCVAPYPDLKQRWSRFPLLRDFLEECKECTGPVLVTDFRDTFFQRDPFGDGAPAVSGLEVFQEHSSQRTTHWIVQVPVRKCKNIDFDEPMLCSGTTVGTREAMLKYLATMHVEMKEWMLDTKCCCNNMNGDDQSIHNYLFYTGKLPFATAVPNRLGRVNTPGVQASDIWKNHHEKLKSLGYTDEQSRKTSYPGAVENGTWIGTGYGVTDEKGYLTNLDSSRSRVVHQFDRFRWPINHWMNRNSKDIWD